MITRYTNTHVFTEPSTKEYINMNCDTCTFQVIPSATSFGLVVEGMVEPDVTSSLELGVINLLTGELVQTVTESGTYSILGVEGMKKITFALQNSEGGNVDIYVNMSDSSAQ